MGTGLLRAVGDARTVRRPPLLRRRPDGAPEQRPHLALAAPLALAAKAATVTPAIGGLLGPALFSVHQPPVAGRRGAANE